MTKQNSQLPFEIRSSPIQGLGAFATREIEEGERIIEYTGERISHDEANSRYDDEGDTQAHVLLFIVDEEIVIDGGVGGNEAVYINHSCEPNCQAFTEGEQVFIYATQDIQIGEELTFDYSLERSDEYDPEWDRLYACHCGAKTCRGTLMAPSSLEE